MNTFSKNTPCFVCLFVVSILVVMVPFSGYTQIERLKEIETGLKRHFEEYSLFRVTYINITHVDTPAGPEFTVEHVNSMKDLLDRMKTGELRKDEERFRDVSVEEFEETVKRYERMLYPHEMETIKVYSMDGKTCRVDGYRTEGSPEHFYHIFDQINGYLITDSQPNVNVRSSKGFTRQWVIPTYPILFGSGIGRYLEYDLRVTAEDPMTNTITLSYPDRGKELEVRYTLLEKDSPYWSKCEVFFGEERVKMFVCEDFVPDSSGLFLPQSVKEYKGNSAEPYQQYYFESAEINAVAFEPGYFQLPYNQEMEVIRIERR